MQMKVSLLSISKLFYFLILLYSGWFQFAFFPISGMMYVLGIGMFVPFAIYIAQKGPGYRLQIPVEFLFWFGFFLYALVTGIFLSHDQNLMLTELLSSVEYLVVAYMVYVISVEDRKIDFFSMIFIVYALICTVTTMLFPTELMNDLGRYSLGQRNANSLGIDIMFGVFCCLKAVDLKKLGSSVLLFGSIVVMIYTIILTGSRKSLLSVVILLLFYLVFSLRRNMKYISSAKKIAAVAILAVVAVIVAVAVNATPMQESMFFRLQDLLQNGMSDSRRSMYQVAMELFAKSPLVGVGYYQFQVLSGLEAYSHSTYAEALSCTGIIGTLLYFIPYILIAYKFVAVLYNLHVRKGNTNELFMWVAFFVALLFLGTGMIHFYELSSDIAFSMILVYLNRFAYADGKDVTSYGAIHQEKAL